jgi:hypothetical protein
MSESKAAEAATSAFRPPVRVGGDGLRVSCAVLTSTSLGVAGWLADSRSRIIPHFPGRVRERRSQSHRRPGGKCEGGEAGVGERIGCRGKRASRGRTWAGCPCYFFRTGGSDKHSFATHSLALNPHFSYPSAASCRLRRPAGCSASRLSPLRSGCCGPTPLRSGPDFPWTVCSHTVRREQPGGKSGPRVDARGTLRATLRVVCLRFAPAAGTRPRGVSRRRV